MSDVLRARLAECLTEYGINPHPLLDIDELAAELLHAVLPVPGADWEGEPIWWRMVHELDICTNCHLPESDCGCCAGCGQPDADIIGSHGYWCAL